MASLTIQPTGMTNAALVDFSTLKPSPIPISTCWQYCLQATNAEGIVSVGAKAKVEITIPGTTTVPANGSTFIVWGHIFTVQSAVDFTSNSAKFTTNGLQTTLNLVSMFQANYYFTNVTVTWAIAGVNLLITLEWNECREQPAFVAESMNFAPGITGAGGSGTFTQGISPVYVEGFKIIERMGFWNPAGTLFTPFAQYSGVEPEKKCLTLGSVCNHHEDDVATALDTLLPELDPFYTAEDANIMRLFSLEYGTISRANCVPVSGTIQKSNIAIGINADFGIDEKYQMQHYWPNHSSGLPPGKSVVSFLTTQPNSLNVYNDSFCWLYLLSNYGLAVGTHSFKLRFVCYKADGTTTILTQGGTTDPAHWYKVHRFDVSPQKVYTLGAGSGITPANLAYYDVQVVIDKNDLSLSINASEYMRYFPNGSCNSANTDLYFKTSRGTIGTVAVRVDDVSQVREDAVEVMVNTPCVSTRHSAATSKGKTIVSLRRTKKVQISFELPNTEGWQRWVQDLQKADKHWLRVKTDENETMISPTVKSAFAQKFHLATDELSTAPFGTGIKVSLTGYLEN